MKKIITLIIFLYGAQLVYSQNIRINNLYNQERFIFNPAQAGSKGSLAAFVDARTQWAGFEGAPKTTSFGIHGSFMEQMGLGLLVSSDKRGVFEETSVHGAYSYGIKVTDKQSLTFGASIGAMRMNINRAKVTGFTLNMDDQALYDNYVDKTSIEGGAGMVYNINNVFELGISSPRLFTLNRHYIGMASFNFRFAEDKFAVQPSFFYQYFPESPNQFDANLMLEWNKTIWLQGTYRSNENLIFGLGVNLGQIGIGYAYEINSGSLSSFSNGSHEVMVTFNFGSELERYKSKNRELKEKIIEKDEEKLDEIDKMKEQIDRLERELEMEKKIRLIEKEIEHLRESREDVFVEATDTVIVEKDEVIVLDEKSGLTEESELGDKQEYDANGFAIAKGNYVVIYTVNNDGSAKKLKEMLAERDIKSGIAMNKKKGYYYMYTYYSKDLDKALTKMQWQREHGFSKAWVCILK